MITKNLIAIHESKDSDKVVKFINQNILNKDIKRLIDMGGLYGLYLNEDGVLGAQDIWGNTYLEILETQDIFWPKV